MNVAKVSFIIPAYNEEAWVGRAVESVHCAARAIQIKYEIVVANDDSTDRTAEIARHGGAQVVDVKCRQIAAVRNAGARAATGDVFIFLDADTLLPEDVLRAALAALESGAIAGGARVRMDHRQPFGMRVFMRAFSLFYFTLMRWAAGCFIFVRREAFEKAGGFDERYYASEEVHFSRALKRQGRFVILKELVVTSDRKVRMYSPREMLRPVWAVMFRGRRALQKREGLDLWYDGRRQGSERQP
jgi:glycosyltransferase involved in cell wall biosynthesis